MHPCLRVAGAVALALLAMPGAGRAQPADSIPTRGPLPGRGGIGGQIGTSWIVSEGDYSLGSQPRFTFVGHFRYVINKSWGWQVSPYFSWNGYVSHVDADPELARAQAFGVGHAREVRAQRVRRTHRPLGGGKLGERAVAQELHDPPAVRLDHRADDGLEPAHRTDRLAFVRLRECGVADQIREPYRGEMMGRCRAATGSSRIAHRVPVPLRSAASSFSMSSS